MNKPQNDYCCMYASDKTIRSFWYSAMHDQMAHEG